MSDNATLCYMMAHNRTVMETSELCNHGQYDVKRIDRQAGRQADRQAGRQTDRQTDRQMLNNVRLGYMICDPTLCYRG